MNRIPDVALCNALDGVAENLTIYPSAHRTHTCRDVSSLPVSPKGWVVLLCFTSPEVLAAATTSYDTFASYRLATGSILYRCDDRHARDRGCGIRSIGYRDVMCSLTNGDSCRKEGLFMTRSSHETSWKSGALTDSTLDKVNAN